MKPLSIGIAGAGTAGLAAATHLARAGHRVHVLERFAAPQPVGAGLMLQPTGLAALACLELDQTAIDFGRIMHGISGRTAAGRTIFETRYDRLGATCHGLALHRAALFHVLHSAAVEAGTTFKTACDITGSRLTRDGRVLLDQGGGEHGPFDLVIDASGTKSLLRGSLVRTRYERPYPYGAVWGVAPEAAGWSQPNHLQQRYIAAHTMVGVLPIGHVPGNPTPSVALFWSLPVADYEQWRATPFAQWQARVCQIWPQIDAIVSHFKEHTDLTFASYADILVDPPVAERIVFIGDAARSSSPQLGQGANLALIDAMVLADCLREQTGIPDALHAYAAARRHHARFYARASRLLTPFFQSDSRLAAGLRDLMFRPAARLPYIEREMVRTLAGMKTGLFTHLEPGDWHPRYRSSR